MATPSNCLPFFFIIILVLNSFAAIRARPFDVLKNPRDDADQGIGGFFDVLYLGGMKQSGPSPGDGHKFTNAATLGGIKDSGPSPGNGHKYVHGMPH